MPEFPNGVPGHVFTMTIDWSRRPVESVGTCECGFVHRERRKPPYLLASMRMDEAVEKHWRAVSAGAAP